MSEVPTFDSKNLDALRGDLKKIRENARATGVVKPGGAGSSTSGWLASKRVAATSDEGSTEKGRQMASAMLGLLRSGADSGAARVPGTSFTETGVERFLKQLDSPKKPPGPAAAKIIERIKAFLATAGSAGSQTVAGISVERLRMLGRMLEQVEKHGWDHLRQMKDKRAKAQPAAPSKPAPKAPAAKRKWNRAKVNS